MLKKTLFILTSFVAILAGYLAFWPVPISPLRWQPAANLGYAGVHAANTKLANLQTISIGAEIGPEHIAVGPDGKLYAAVAGGKILRMSPDGAAQEVFANTGGRVLGFDFDAAGNMLAADAERGLLQITPTKNITVLADKVADKVGDKAVERPILYADAVVVAKSGLVYLSDASTRFSPKVWGGTFEASVLDILEQSATGRIIEYNPTTKASRIVAKGLSFANGVALSGDEASLFVNETGKYRVWKIAVAAKELDVNLPGSAPLSSVLLDNLPGHPDNLMRGLPTEDGKTKIWLGFAKPRGAAVDSMADKPWLREITLRLPRALWPIPPQYGHVIAFTEDGKIVADLQDPTGAYPETTGVTETADRLYIQSLHAKTLGWLKK